MTRPIPEPLVSTERYIVFALSTTELPSVCLPGLEDVIAGRVKATNAQRTQALYLARILKAAADLNINLSREAVYAVDFKED